MPSFVVIDESHEWSAEQAAKLAEAIRPAVAAFRQLADSLAAVVAVPGMREAVAAAVADARDPEAVAAAFDRALNSRIRVTLPPPPPPLPSPDAMRLDASRAEADAELAEWRALLDGAKGRRVH